MKSKVRLGILIVPCILSPGLQAEEKPGPHWGYRLMELLMKHRIDIISLPCPESTFGGYQSGLQRGKHGIGYYESLEGYSAHCIQLAIQVADMIADMYAGGYSFICVLGVEHSPTCAVNYIYSHDGMLKRAGIFFRLLEEELRKSGLEIPQVGINRTYPNKGITLLEKMIRDSEEKAGKRGEGV